MRLRDGVSVGFGCAALGVSIFALGGAPRWAQAIVAVLVAGALTPHLLSRRSLQRPSPLLVAIGVAWLLTLVQLVPLPRFMLELLQPVGHAMREDGAELLGLSPWRSISLDVPATLRALAFFTILLGVASQALRFAATARGRYYLLAAVAGSCGLVAVVIALHSLFDAKLLFGVYEIKQAKPSVLGPLLNENHLGCLLAIGTVVALGLVTNRQQTSMMRVAWFIVAAACGAATVATQSRGATLALIVGVCVAVGIRLGQRLTSATGGPPRRGAAFISNTLPVAAVAASALVVIVYLSAGGVAEQLSQTSLGEMERPKSKFVAWRSAIHLVEETPWTGVGRGALEPAFTHLHPASALAIYSHVENEYLQAVVDWGIPGALAVAAALLWLLVTMLRRWRDGSIAAAALGALAVVAVQSCVDFGVELLGVAVPITIVAATLAHVPLREAEQKRQLRARALRGTLIAGLLGSALLLVLPATMSIAEDHEALVGKDLPTLDRVVEHLDRHPLDYYGYAVASEIMIRKGDRRGIRLLNQALTLHPTHSGLHLRAARLLYTAGFREQSTIEYAAALHGTVEERRKLITEIAGKFPTELAAAAIPTDNARVEETVLLLQELGKGDLAVMWLDQALARSSSLRGCDQFYGLAMQMQSSAVVAKANRRCKGFEPTREVRVALGKLLVASGDYAEAIVMLGDVETWPGRVDEKIAAWLTVCDAHASLQHWDEARHCLRRLDLLIPEGTDVAQRLVKLREQQTAAREQATGSGSGSAAAPEPSGSAKAP